MRFVTQEGERTDNAGPLGRLNRMRVARLSQVSQDGPAPGKEGRWAEGKRNRPSEVQVSLFLFSFYLLIFPDFYFKIQIKQG